MNHRLWNKRMLAMYVDTLLMSIGFFMLVPLLTVHLIQDLSWSASMAGIVLAVSSFSVQAFKFGAGLLADRIGYKLAILLGVGVRVIGFTMYAFADGLLDFL